MTEEIRLRSYWFVPRKPSVLVDGERLVIRLPTYFGRHRWRLAVDQVALVAPLAEEEAEIGSDAFFVQGLEIPYLFTTGPATVANLVLVFASAERVPPVRLLAAQRTIGAGWFGSRSTRGEVLDGVALRVVDPDGARAALVRAGVAVVDEPVTWLAERREVIRDAAAISSVNAAARRARWAARAALLVYVLAFGLLAVGPDPITAPWAALLLVVLVGGVVVRERVRWWSPRRRRVQV